VGFAEHADPFHESSGRVVVEEAVRGDAADTEVLKAVAERLPHGFSCVAAVGGVETAVRRRTADRDGQTFRSGTTNGRRPDSETGSLFGLLVLHDHPNDRECPARRPPVRLAYSTLSTDDRSTGPLLICPQAATCSCRVPRLPSSMRAASVALPGVRDSAATARRSVLIG
jgi:hypothetical protein